jgi:hypothetical protein
MVIMMSREQAAAAVAAAAAERDGIQANLLDLDGSFGKRLLAGAVLSGQTRARWEDACAGLAGLWETFTAYSAVIDRAGLLLGQVRRASSPELAEISALLTGPSVRLVRAPAPLAARGLTDRRTAELTPALAVHEMTLAFRRVAEVLTAAETVWNQLAGGLEEVDVQLRQARLDAAGLASQDTERGSPESVAVGALRAAEGELGRQRAALNADPLAYWQGGSVDVSHLGLLRQEAASAAAQVREIAAVRAQAEQRITDVAAAVAAVGAAAREAAAARARAAERIVAGELPPVPPDPGILAGRLAGLEPLRAQARWSRLGGELAAIQQEAAAALDRCRDSERAARDLLSRRDELRGLLGAYAAKAARLAGPDNALASFHDRARDLLWTAPCDLGAAAAAVTRYQEAIVALSRPGQREVTP